MKVNTAVLSVMTTYSLATGHRLFGQTCRRHFQEILRQHVILKRLYIPNYTASQPRTTNLNVRHRASRCAQCAVRSSEDMPRSAASPAYHTSWWPFKSTVVTMCTTCLNMQHQPICCAPWRRTALTGRLYSQSITRCHFTVNRVPTKVRRSCHRFSWKSWSLDEYVRAPAAPNWFQVERT